VYCTELLAKGLALEAAAAIAGHSSPLLTVSFYVNRQTATLERIRLRLAGYLFGFGGFPVSRLPLTSLKWFGPRPLAGAIFRARPGITGRPA
jgi:hypothetical protein